MPTTRANPSDQSCSSGDVTDQEEVCVVSRDALEQLIREVADSRCRQKETNEIIAQNLEQIAKTMAELSNNIVTSTTMLSGKLDSLIEAVKHSNTVTAAPSDVEEHLKQRKSLTERIVRNEFVTAYYDELLQEDRPFVRKEFRTKVHKNASDTDLRNRRQQTIDNVKWEIKIMQDRMVEFRDKKQKLDEKIEEFLKQNESSRVDVAERMQRMDTKTKEEYERDKLSLMKKTDAEEKGILTEYLLTFQGDDTTSRNKSKNSRGQPANRRPPRRGHKSGF